MSQRIRRQLLALHAGSSLPFTSERPGRLSSSATLQPSSSFLPQHISSTVQVSLSTLLTVYSELHLITIYYLKMHMLRLVVSGLGLVACTTARNIFSLQPNRQGSHLLPLTHGDAPDHKLVERGSNPRCGPDHGKCPEGKCCSTAGISTYL